MVPVLLAKMVAVDAAPPILISVLDAYQVNIFHQAVVLLVLHLVLLARVHPTV